MAQTIQLEVYNEVKPFPTRELNLIDALVLLHFRKLILLALDVSDSELMTGGALLSALALLDSQFNCSALEDMVDRYREIVSSSDSEKEERK